MYRDEHKLCAACQCVWGKNCANFPVATKEKFMPRPVTCRERASTLRMHLSTGTFAATCVETQGFIQSMNRELCTSPMAGSLVHTVLSIFFCANLIISKWLKSLNFQFNVAIAQNDDNNDGNILCRRCPTYTKCISTLLGYIDWAIDEVAAFWVNMTFFTHGYICCDAVAMVTSFSSAYQMSVSCDIATESITMHHICICAMT